MHVTVTGPPSWTATSEIKKLISGSIYVAAMKIYNYIYIVIVEMPPLRSGSIPKCWVELGYGVDAE
jgi:hypothetical protein